VDKIHKNLGYVPFFYKGQCYCTIGWVDFWRKFDFEWDYPWNLFIFM
jgi:hypothetical protein